MKKIIIAVAIALTVGIRVYAQQLQIDYNQETSEITIGISGIEKNSALISVVNGEYEQGTDITSRDCIFFGELYSDDTIICKIPQKAHSGEYTIAAVIDGELKTKSFWYTNKDEAASALEKLKNAPNAAAVKTIIDEEHDRLGIDYEEFKLYADDISRLFFSLFTGTDKSLEDFRDTYYGAYAMSKSKKLDQSGVESLILDYSAELGISRQTYNALADETKREFIKQFSSGEIHQDNIKAQIKEYLFLSEINTEKSWKQFLSLISDKYKEYLDLDLKKLTSSGQQENFLKQLMQRTPYNSKQDFLTEYNSVTSQTKKNPTTSSGGGGGSGSSSGGYVKTDVSVETPKADKENRFEDVNKSHWAYDSIEKLASEGIVNGVDNNSFMPDSNITRAEFAAMAVRMFFKGEKASGSSFHDVSQDDWYYEPISVLNAKGVLNGDDFGNANPTQNITRQDACVIISRILNIFSDSDVTFDDAEEISGYAKNSISALCGRGIVNGRDNNRFAPHDCITRAETAAVLYRISENTEEDK